MTIVENPIDWICGWNLIIKNLSEAAHILLFIGLSNSLSSYHCEADADRGITLWKIESENSISMGFVNLFKLIYKNNFITCYGSYAHYRPS